jgi:hypothetical protein
MSQTTPAVHGYYWATDTVNGLRQVVRVDVDGFGHTRVFTTRYRVKNLLDFTDWNGPLTEDESCASAT